MFPWCSIECKVLDGEGRKVRLCGKKEQIVVRKIFKPVGYAERELGISNAEVVCIYLAGECPKEKKGQK